MTLHQLKIFLTVARLGSFTLAGKELRLTQSSVSSLMLDLQKELGVKLFEKLGLKSQLTEEGKKLRDRAHSALVLLGGFKDDLDELRGLKKGKLSVGSAGIGTPLILPAVQEFKKRYPGVHVSLTIQKTPSLQRKLLEGDLDVAILGRPSPSPLVLAEPYRDEEFVFIAPPKHPLAKKRSVTLKLLAKEPLITFENDTFSPIVAQRFAEAGLQFQPLLAIDLEMGSRDAVKSAVASGLGIAFLTKCHVLGDAKAGRLKVLKVPELQLKRTMYIGVHKNRRESPLVKALVDFLKTYKG